MQLTVQFVFHSTPQLAGDKYRCQHPQTNALEPMGDLPIYNIKSVDTRARALAIARGHFPYQLLRMRKSSA
jgi:hypothetical protein